MSEADGTRGGELLAVIPARGGSKRLPRKNLLPLGGKPLIRWSLEVARDSGVVDHLVVSSDDREILAEARAFGAIPLQRPEDLATDAATTSDVLLHALDWLGARGIRPKQVMLLQPTSPLRTVEDILGAIALFEDKHANGIVSVSEAAHSPLWCNTLDRDGRLDRFLGVAAVKAKSQALPTYYCINGAIYLTSVSVFRKHKSFVVPNCYAYIMPAERSVDIDTAWDLFLAECCLARAGVASVGIK